MCLNFHALKPYLVTCYNTRVSAIKTWPWPPLESRLPSPCQLASPAGFEVKKDGAAGPERPWGGGPAPPRHRGQGRAEPRQVEGNRTRSDSVNNKQTNKHR